MRVFKIIFLFFTLIKLYSQENYQINNFGTYIISNNNIHIVSNNYMDYELSFLCIRDNYAIFTDKIFSILIIHDIDKNITSDEIINYQYTTTEIKFGIYNKDDEIIISAWNNIYILDKETLRIKSYNFNITDIRINISIFNQERTIIHKNIINNNTIQLNNNINIIIDQSLWNEPKLHPYSFSLDFINFYLSINNNHIIIHVYYWPYHIR